MPQAIAKVDQYIISFPNINPQLDFSINPHSQKL